MAEATQQKPEEQREVPLEEALKLAQGHHQMNNFLLAERTYRDILRAVPDHFPTTHLLGILLFQNGNYQESLDYFQKAVAAAPENQNCWNNYGAVLTECKRYEEALEAFDQALALEPNYVDALDNKAFVLGALGRYEKSEALSRKVLDNIPDSHTALNNLGMALSRQEKYEEALEIWEKSAEAHPDQASVWTNWGNTLREMGRIQGSEEKCRKALSLEPDDPDALNNLANALRDQGKPEEAVEYYQKATDLKPDLYLAHNNKAIAYMDQEKYAQAIIAARYAVAFKDDFSDAYGCMARAFLEMGEYQKAHMAAQRAVTHAPEEAAHYLDLADVLLRADRLDDGRASLEQALKLEPDSQRCLLRLAEIYDRMNETEEALETIDKAIALNPALLVVQLRKAQIQHGNNYAPEALETIENILKMRPDHLPALQTKAEILISVNENEQAEKLARQVMEINKDLPGPYALLTSVKKFKSEKDDDFKAMLELHEKSGSLGLKQSGVLNFALADAYEQIGEYDTAFKFLEKANDEIRKFVPYDTSKVPQTYEGPKARFNPEFLEKNKDKGYKSDVPVFIVGMPRSGTTLTEQTLSAHPQVFGAGELSDIGKVRALYDSGAETDLKALGREYVELIRAHEKPEPGKAARITDKMPGNYFNIGFILSILPNAKIIHCRRNPVDTCLSCYKQNFARGQYWSYKQEELADEYLRYLDLMAYWRKVLPGRFLEIDYEDTVGDFENQARRLIEYAGLEWDAACLKPHKQKRTVLTASKAQVTKPVYKTSVEKWRRYEKHLQPLVRKLLPDQARPEAG